MSAEPDETAEALEQGYRSIWEAIDAIMCCVPAEVLDRLPEDGAEQHDHYLYDSPKKAPHTS
jgi:hypothetical protein